MEEEEEDRMSQLPDVILQHILSLVDLKQAVETSILSKRWRHLWSTLPDLDFNRSGLVHADILVQHFALQFLSHRDHTSTIYKFQLPSTTYSHMDTDPIFLNTCVDYAVTHGVRQLDIETIWSRQPPLPFKFPAAFLGCKSLRLLTLRKRGDESMIVPKPFVLPNLNSLSLECFSFDDHDDYSFSSEPFSGFPNLEKLFLHECCVSGLVISTPKLKMLEISEHRGFWHREEAIVERIIAPALTCFKYEECLPFKCWNMDFPLLEEVCLNVYLHRSRVNRKIFLDCFRMLEQLGNAKFVTLSLDTCAVLEFDLHLLERMSRGPFGKLECLKLEERPSNVEQVYYRDSTKTVVQGVMNYFTKGFCHSVEVELPEGVSIIETRPSETTSLSEDEDDEDDIDGFQLHRIFR